MLFLRSAAVESLRIRVLPNSSARTCESNKGVFSNLGVRPLLPLKYKLTLDSYIIWYSVLHLLGLNNNTVNLYFSGGNGLTPTTVEL